MRALLIAILATACSPAADDEAWLCADSASCRTDYVGGYQQAYDDCGRGNYYDDTRGPDGSEGWTVGYADGWADGGCD